MKDILISLIFGPACFCGFIYQIARMGFGWGQKRADEVVAIQAENLAQQKEQT